MITSQKGKDQSIRHIKMTKSTKFTGKRRVREIEPITSGGGHKKYKRILRSNNTPLSSSLADGVPGREQKTADLEK